MDAAFTRRFERRRAKGGASRLPIAIDNFVVRIGSSRPTNLWLESSDSIRSTSGSSEINVFEFFIFRATGTTFDDGRPSLRLLGPIGRHQ